MSLPVIPVLLLLVLLLSGNVPGSDQSIFSSLIRNNLNRYLKNPLFTKSFVRTSSWQPDPDAGTGGGLMPSPSAQPLLMSQPGHGSLDEFLKTQNQFANEHMLESPFGSQFRFPTDKMPRMTNEFMKLHHSVIDPTGSAKIDPAPFSVPHEDFSFGLKALFNETKLNVNLPSPDNSKRSRANSKSLHVPASGSTNAYSDPGRVNNYSGKKSSPKQNLTSFYVNDGPLNHAESNEIHRFISAKNKNKQNKNDLRTLESRLRNSNKYNQEKALNLKLEYGFRPLPSSKKESIFSANSIQMNDSDAEDSNDEEPSSILDQDQQRSQQLSLYQSLFNRTMKSFESRGNNHLDELSSDYKKYISYPMETESSDVHRLAFTGVESFRPDHNYLGMMSGYDPNYRMLDVISNYPNIKNFRTQGIECARQAGYCEYDSSYPIDFVNSIITNCTAIIDDMYTEMPENIDDFSGYKSLFHVFTGTANHHNQVKNNATLCDAERKYIRPSVIKDVHNEYHLILQSSFYFQQLPVEICLNPGSACNHIGRCNQQAKVRCTQKYRMHTLISVVEPANEPDYLTAGTKPNCPKMRMYRLPSACVCEMAPE